MPKSGKRQRSGSGGQNGQPDPPHVRLSKTMSFLLKHRPEVGDLELDEEGWVELEKLCVATTGLLHREVTVQEITVLVERSRIKRFELRETRIRATPSTRRSHTPDILYHATTSEQIERYRRSGAVQKREGRQIFLSADESQAWRAAHRTSTASQPQVLFVDAARARRHGIFFQRNRRNGLYVAKRIPVSDVLNLQDNFAEQLSAGGIPMLRGPSGVRLALIQVTRRSGVTWEIAKGKLEPGETPEHAAVREVQEEMGLEVGLEVTRSLGMIRYGFMAPGGLPRLKTVFVYLMRPTAPLPEDPFAPSEREGIGAVRWFTPSAAARAVRHSSLQPLMRHVKEMLR